MTTLRTSILTVALLMGCSAAQEVTNAPRPEREPPEEGFIIAGVDTNVARQAAHLAKQSFAEDAKRDEAARFLAEGRSLTKLADSLLASSDTTRRVRAVNPATAERSIRAFNAGARALERYAAESDSARAAQLLEVAEEQLEESLEANPFDSEVHYWLSRVYDLQASNLKKSEAYEKALDSLRRLAAMNQDDHRIAALLASAYERWSDAGERDSIGVVGALWQRAAEIAADDAMLSPTGMVAVDSVAVFDYYIRSSRALVRADRSVAARLALNRASRWVRTKEDRDFVQEERRWILWDNGNLATRKRFDELLALANTDPGRAARGMEGLLGGVNRLQARDEVRHQLALLWYGTGSDEKAAVALHALWQEMTERMGVDYMDVVRQERVREDFGTVAYNLAQKYRQNGDARRALAYLLQSEETGFAGAARAAFDVARLLRNNVDAALEAAHRAESRIAQMKAAERLELYRYLIELYRRRGERVEAMRYLQKFRSVSTTGEEVLR